MPDTASTAVLTARYARGLDVAVVTIVAVWHVGGAGQLLQRHLDSYGSPALQIACWIVIGLVITVGGVLLLTGRDHPVIVWAAVSVDLLVCVIATYDIPRDAFLEINWVWASATWTGVLLLMRRPFRELIAFLLTAVAVTFAHLFSGGGPHRVELAGFLTSMYGNASTQLAAAICARALAIPARQAAEAAVAEAEISTARAISEAVHTARRTRYHDLRETVQPLVASLAEGELSPADPAVRHRCLAAATRLRRLFAESDDTPDPLVHELRVCADEAERRGITVELEVAGQIPVIPASVRRELVEATIDVLVGARTRARITVVADGAEVAVGIVADAPYAPVGVASGHVAVDAQRDRREVWVEARWKAP